MDSDLAALSQAELLGLALEATRNGDSGRSLVYLKEAGGRAESTEQVHLLLGSEYAQIGLLEEARAHFQRSLEINPDFAIARFQLGLLYLTSGQPQPALDVWSPLAALGNSHPLQIFHKGLQHLIRDEFSDCVQCLEAGIAANLENPPLNVNMQLVIERIAGLASDPKQPVPQSTADGTSEELQSHLFLNAYTGGKVH